MSLRNGGKPCISEEIGVDQVVERSGQKERLRYFDSYSRGPIKFGLLITARESVKVWDKYIFQSGPV